MSSKLYVKDNYLNKNIDMIINKSIIEYDIKSANTSLCKEYKLLSDKKIEEIENMNKQKRVVYIGKLMRKDKYFRDALKESFVDIRHRFFISNQIQDNHVHSIKKDAIFTLKDCDTLEIGKCKFIEKNRYTSFIYLNNLELYYKSGSGFRIPQLDIKGISDEILIKHQSYMIDFLKVFFNHIETSSTQVLFNYLKRFISKYKKLELDIGYYREFNNQSIIRLIDSDETYDLEEFIPYENKHEHVDINYNFFNIILPLINKII